MTRPQAPGTPVRGPTRERTAAHRTTVTPHRRLAPRTHRRCPPRPVDKNCPPAKAGMPDGHCAALHVKSPHPGLASRPPVGLDGLARTRGGTRPVSTPTRDVVSGIGWPAVDGPGHSAPIGWFGVPATVPDADVEHESATGQESTTADQPDDEDDGG